MHINTNFIYRNSDTDYRVLVTLTDTDGKLDGYAKDITVSGDHTHVVLGQFKDGLLNGIGVKLENGVCIESGLYEDGRLVDIEAFKASAKKTIVEKTEKYGITYVDSELFYQGESEKGKEGYALLVCDKLVRYFITGEQVIKGERSCLSFMEYKNGEQVGIIAFINHSKEKGTTYDYYVDYSDRLTGIIANKDVHPRFFEWKNRKVKEGTTVLKKGYMRAKSSIVLHLPSSIEQLEDSVIASKEKYYLEVYYEGSQEEWNNIEKGRYEDGVTEDFYGYYYHNSERYVPTRNHYDWAKNAEVIIIHCSDGDILTHDTSY